MPYVPSRLPERGRFAALFRWMNQLRDYVLSLTPVISHNTETQHANIGVIRQGKAKGGEGATGEDELVWF